MGICWRWLQFFFEILIFDSPFWRNYGEAVEDALINLYDVFKNIFNTIKRRIGYFVSHFLESII